LKHLFPHPHILTGWLYSGAQPHAPMAQEFGKSPALSQQFAVVTVPPDAMQPCSAAEAVAEGAIDAVGALVGVTVGIEGVGVAVPFPSRQPTNKSATPSSSAINRKLFLVFMRHYHRKCNPRVI